MENATVNSPVQGAVQSAETQKTHPLMKSYMFVSTKHVDYNDLSAFEAISMSLVLVLAATVGTVMTMV